MSIEFLCCKHHIRQRSGYKGNFTCKPYSLILRSLQPNFGNYNMVKVIV